MTIHLSAGNHRSPNEGACVMEVVSLLAKQPWTDHPTCTNEVITRAAQAVNDRLNDTERQRLVMLIPRIMRARRTDSDVRVNVRLALWAARSVLHLVGDSKKEPCERALRAVELWLAGGEVSEEELRNAAASAAAASYASAADAASAAASYASAADAASAAASSAAAASYASASYAASSAADAASAAASSAAADPVMWLDSLLDAWEKAVNEEGEAIYESTPWEDEALEYLAANGS